MKNFIQGIFILSLLGFAVSSCQDTDQEAMDLEVPQDVIIQLQEMGFNPDGIEIVEEGYRIERDIIIRPQDLENDALGVRISNKGDLKQYRTTNLVSTGGNRTIKVYMPVGGRKGFNSNYNNALIDAMGRFNSENLEITFVRESKRNRADIKVQRLSRRDENRGVLGSAGFPSGGDPYGTIKLSGIIDSGFGWSTNAIATVMAHEIGHCIGLRHTDYFDRSLSCGGAPTNEGQAGVGAIHIPGTTTGFSPGSWMLSCSDGTNRPFNQDDQDALDYLY